MTKFRSVQITFMNNTPFTLTQYHENICHGSFQSAPPATIESKTTVSWTAADKDFSVGTGTEGWVKYSCPWAEPIEGQPINYQDLVWIYWDNPYIPDNSIPPISFKTSSSDISALNSYCEDGPPWPGPFVGTPSTTLATELFMSSSAGSGGGFNFGSSGAGPTWDVVFGWPLILIDAASDINLEFTIGLRQINPTSIAQSIGQVYNGLNGLRQLAVQAHQPSLKKLFAIGLTPMK